MVASKKVSHGGLLLSPLPVRLSPAAGGAAPVSRLERPAAAVLPGRWADVCCNAWASNAVPAQPLNPTSSQFNWKICF